MKIYYKIGNPQSAMAAYLLGKELDCPHLIPKTRNANLNVKAVTREPVIFVGYSPKPRTILALANHATSITVYTVDSEETRELEEYANEINLAVPLFIHRFRGCLLESIWNQISSAEPPAQVKVVIDNYYRTGNETEVNAFAYYHAIGFTAESAKIFMEEPLYSADLKGAIIFKYRDNFDNRIIKRAYVTTLDGHTVACLSVPSELIGETLPLLKKKFRSVEFFIFLQWTAEGLRCRLRTNGKTNVGEIAKGYGGDGTPESGSFILKQDFSALCQNFRLK